MPLNKGRKAIVQGFLGEMLFSGLFHSAVMLSIRYRWFVREGDSYGVWEKGNVL